MAAIESLLVAAKDRYVRLTKERGMFNEDVKLYRALITTLENELERANGAQQLLVDLRAASRAVRDNADTAIWQVDRFHEMWKTRTGKDEVRDINRG